MKSASILSATRLLVEALEIFACHVIHALLPTVTNLKLKFWSFCLHRAGALRPDTHRPGFFGARKSQTSTLPPALSKYFLWEYYVSPVITRYGALYPYCKTSVTRDYKCMRIGFRPLDDTSAIERRRIGAFSTNERGNGHEPDPSRSLPDHRLSESCRRKPWLG
jgi:hypothetical protein